MSKDIHTMDELRTKLYGAIGTPKRDKIEKELIAFREKIKERGSMDEVFKILDKDE